MIAPRGSISSMRYKVVGYVVWRGASWYLHRRFGGLGRKLAIAGGVGLALASGAAVFAATKRSKSA
jgi:hypothetical protein